MTQEEISHHNMSIRMQLKELHEKQTAELNALKSKLIVPCDKCPYDGVYRCEACQEDNFIGFNRSELPWDIHDDYHESDESDFESK